MLFKPSFQIIKVHVYRKFSFLFLHKNICSGYSLEAPLWGAFDEYPKHMFSWRNMGWSGGAKVLCILHHWGVQLILAYSWARPAILVVGKGRGGMFLFLLFLHFHSCSSFFPVPLFHLLYSLSSISFLPFSGRRHKMTLKGWRVVKPQHWGPSREYPKPTISWRNKEK